MNDSETVLYEKKGHVAWLTINRPEARNALNDTVRTRIVSLLDDAREDNEIYVIVITGAGDKAFCAGADISEFPKLASTDQIKRHGRINAITYAREVPKPVIAMVNGLALGGGAEIVLSCDIAIAAETAQFGLPEIRVGVFPGGGGTQVLPRLIGEKRAKEMIFTGKLITAAEAFQMGMINKVVPPDQLKLAVEEFVGVLLKRSPIILKIAKLAVNRSMETTLSAGLATERDLFSFIFSTADQKEGARAFLEKRDPKYEGK